MRNAVFPLTAFAALAAVVAVAALPVPTIAQPAAEEPRAADAEPQPFNPQMSALMSMIIQPRHAKLGLAAKVENWALAGYYFKELKAGFGVVGRAIPRWKGLPVPDLIDAALTQHFAVLDFAIKAGEPRQFAEAYDRVTTGCNNCHATTDHPFVVIKSPDASTWSNQEFKPAGR
ncbi:MAG: hypothetical protein QOG83_2986 [Alphaproteobacteria bacterium]|jgi:hypothetical protein|nr:hypothetical protein [Alphaproteobacteria bacterium]MEA2938512.1 hypothetical protein [Alphaproteobacteria bacterium]MEA2990275.1 hypothetical protein [Alphaproteobacteria bacterium]